MLSDNEKLNNLLLLLRFHLIQLVHIVDRERRYGLQDGLIIAATTRCASAVNSSSCAAHALLQQCVHVRTLLQASM